MEIRIKGICASCQLALITETADTIKQSHISCPGEMKVVGSVDSRNPGSGDESKKQPWWGPRGKRLR